MSSSASIKLSGGTYLHDGAEGDPQVDTNNSFSQSSTPIGHATRVRSDVVQVASVSTGQVAFDLKSVDWTLRPGHRLAVEVGTIQAGPLSDWLDTPSRQTIKVAEVTLDLDLDDPAQDAATQVEVPRTWTCTSASQPRSSSPSVRLRSPSLPPAEPPPTLDIPIIKEISWLFC